MRIPRLAVLLISALLLACALFAQGGEFRPSGSHLGVGLMNVDADRATALKLGSPRGVEVKTVAPNSPADVAGIAIGDLLLTYNGEEILSAPQLGRLVSETPSGRKVKLQYWRAGQTKATVITPLAYDARMVDPSPLVPDLQPWNVPDAPRMLMLWDSFVLGVECEPVNPQLAGYFGVESGVLVREVAKRLAGDKAGFKAGDVITALDGTAVASPRDLISFLRTQHQPGKSILVRLMRDRKPRTVSIPPGE